MACKAFDALGKPRADILGFTMPGFATGEGTKANAWALMKALGVTGAEIDIKPAARQLLADLGHPFAKGEPVYDITFENVQAGLRTDYLFRLANQHSGFVLGTGDLSELALGWCTYGVGDQMSHYNVNGSLAKTLIQHLIRWTIKTGQFDGAARDPARHPRHRDLAGTGARRRHGRDPVDPGQGRALRAAGLQPVPHHPLRPAPVEGGVPGLARLARREPGRLAAQLPGRDAQRLRPGGHQEMAGRLPLPLLRDQPVQALGHAQRPQGDLRRRALARAATGARPPTARRGSGWTSWKRTSLKRA